MEGEFKMHADWQLHKQEVSSLNIPILISIDPTNILHNFSNDLLLQNLCVLHL